MSPMFSQVRSTDSIDSGFHSLTIGMRGSKPFFPDPDLSSYTQMVRYRGGRRQARQEIGGVGVAVRRTKPGPSGQAIGSITMDPEEVDETN